MPFRSVPLVAAERERERKRARLEWLGMCALSVKSCLTLGIKTANVVENSSEMHF